ncbi:MAG: putative lipoprotein, partial [Myxococcaceae bacterium]|nr:putative lipoprotein [Myxococcaceae bacterium]
MNRRLLALALMFVSGCGDGAADINQEGDDVLQTDEARLASDKADRGCQVVMRSVARAPGTGGYATRCTTAGCYFVWEGVIDVANAAKTGARPYVLYRSTDATGWTKKLASAITGGPAGYQRYKFRLETKTISAGMSTTSLMRSRLELSPYLLQADGTRLFDHNRVPGDFDVYTLNASNSWAMPEDAAVCRPVGQNRSTIQFLNSGWQTVQHGALVANGTLVIDYDLARLGACRGTHNGYPAFDITAIVRFSPGGQQVEQSVREFDSPAGTPVFSTLHTRPFELTIPSGATRADLWFVNTGLWCSPSYDSNNGQNYRFDVVAPPAKVQWFGNTRSSTSRACVADQNVPDPITLDGYIRERACSFVEGEVYVPGLTDGAALRPELVLARAEATLDGVALPTQWLGFQGRTGNNYR